MVTGGFTQGDNPAWAQPGFDDTHWPLLMTDENWAEQGYDGYSGLAWYRFHVTLPAGLNHVSLYLPYILTSYQVYANGQQIGRYGKMPPHGVPYWGGGWFRTYAIPDSISATRSVYIAIRVWHWPGWAANFGGGPELWRSADGRCGFDRRPRRAIPRRAPLGASQHHDPRAAADPCGCRRARPVFLCAVLSGNISGSAS